MGRKRTILAVSTRDLLQEGGASRRGRHSPNVVAGQGSEGVPSAATWRRRESKNRRKRPKILADPIERVRRYPQNYPQSEATAHRAAQVRSDIMPEVIRLVETSNGGQWRAAVKAR
jgi:hypothetical protein